MIMIAIERAMEYFFHATAPMFILGLRGWSSRVGLVFSFCSQILSDRIPWPDMTSISYMRVYMSYTMETEMGAAI